MRHSFRWLSQSWSLSAGQIRDLFLVDEKRAVLNVQSFLRDLDWDRNIFETSDVIELAHFMHRAQYPKRSKLEERANQWLAVNRSMIGHDEISEICRYYDVGRGYFDRDFWNRLVVSHQWFEERVINCMNLLTFEEIVKVVMMFRSGSDACQEKHAKVFTSIVANLARDKLREVDADELCKLITVICPIDHRKLLHGQLLAHIERLCAKDCVVVASSIELTESNLVFFDKLVSTVKHKSEALKSIDDLVQFLQVLNSKCTHKDALVVEATDIVKKIVAQSPELFVATSQFATFVESAEISRLDGDFRLVISSHHCSSPFAFRAFCRLGMHDEGTKLLAKFQPTDYTTCSSVVHGLAALSHYPDVGLLFVERLLQFRSSVTVSDAAAAVLCLSHTNCAETTKLALVDSFLDCISNVMKFRKHERFPAQSVLQLIHGLSQMRYDVRLNQKLRSLIETFDLPPIGVREASELLLALADINAQSSGLSGRVLRSVHGNISTADAETLVFVATTISILGLRDIHLFSELLRRLCVVDIGVLHVVQAADSARRLRMIQVFQRSELSTRVSKASGLTWSSAEDVSLELFALFIAVCSPSEQARILELVNSLSNLRREYDVEADQMTLSTALLLLSSRGCVSMFQRQLRQALKSVQQEKLEESFETDLFLRCVSNVADKANELLAPLVTVCESTVLAMNESEINDFVCIVLSMPQVPNSIFRVVGRRIASLSETMTPEHAVACLSLYSKWKVRDDKVVKGLLNRCIHCSTQIANTPNLINEMKKVAECYSHWSQPFTQSLAKLQSSKSKRERERSLRKF